MNAIDKLRDIEKGVTDLDEAIDAVVGAMLADERLYDGKLYQPVGGERGLVELAGQVLTPLRNHWPQIVDVVEAADELYAGKVRPNDKNPYQHYIVTDSSFEALTDALDALRSALAGMEER